MVSIAVVVLAFLILVGAQCWVLLGFGRRAPVGDEKDYLARATAADPYAPGLFLRPPGMAFVSHLMGSETRVRGILALAGCAAAALVALAAWLSAGGLVALVALLCLLLPERLILACHVWPDTLLAVVSAGVVLVLSLPGPAGTQKLLALAILAALGTLIRVDFASLAPLTGLALAVSGRMLEPADWALLLAPTALALALWTAHNARRYGRWLSDDTWAFNAMLAAEQAAEPPARRGFALEPVVARVLRRWIELPPAERTAVARRLLVGLAARPLRLLDGALRRALALLGPDTFVRQLLLPRRAAYPEVSPTTRRLAEPLLRLGFPLLVTACLVGTVLTRSGPPIYLLPVLGTLAGGVLFHFRTRYRVAVMPALALWAADVGTRSFTLLQTRSPGLVVLVAAAGLATVWLLGRIELGRELPDARESSR